LRVGIVNDLKLAVRALSQLVESEAGNEIAWIAEDGLQAVDKAAVDLPDLILMDLIMPNLDGVEATRQIMRSSPCPILVVTATVEGNLTKVYNALGAGALDAVSGPTYAPDGSLADTEPVLKKMRTMRRLMQPLPAANESKKRRSSGGFPHPSQPAPRLLVIGASTGGPRAIVDVITGFSPDFRPPVLVVQHLDESFIPGFVSWLSSQTGWPVASVAVGDQPEPGKILVAASGDHMVMSIARRLRYEAEPLDLVYRPSVDVFWESLARSWPTPGVAILLTGMGRDGARGMLALRKRGWQTLAHDEASSVVWGMPRAAAQDGAATAVVSLEQMGARAERAFKKQEADEGLPTEQSGA
jgi:two-component system response regulator WspF